MAAPQLKTKTWAIPCPKCQKQNPVDARICTCGHWFVQKEPAREILAFPALRDVLPELQDVFPKSHGEDVGGQITEITVPVSETVMSTLRDERTSRIQESGTVEPQPRQTEYFKFNPIESTSKIWWYSAVACMLICWIAAALFWSGYTSFSDQSVDQDGSVQFVQSDAPTGLEVLQAENSTTAASLELGPIADEDSPAPKTDGESETNEVHGGPRTSTQGEAPSNADAQKLTVMAESPAKTSNVASTVSGREASNLSAAVSDPHTLKNDATLSSDSVKESKGETNSAVPLAQCSDGTYSYTKSGTCAYRGGVSSWLDGSKSPAKVVKGERSYVLGSRGGCYYLKPGGSKIYVDKNLCN